MYSVLEMRVKGRRNPVRLSIPPSILAIELVVSAHRVINYDYECSRDLLKGEGDVTDTHLDYS